VRGAYTPAAQEGAPPTGSRAAFKPESPEGMGEPEAIATSRWWAQVPRGGKRRIKGALGSVVAMEIAVVVEARIAR